MARSYFVPLDTRQTNRHIGNKAKNIHFLIRRGIDVPPGWVCLWDARTDFLREKGEEVMSSIRKQLTVLLRDGQAYAVRSSANVEDESSCSFAGQFKSVLGVCGVEPVLGAIGEVWNSADSPDVHSYIKDSGRGGQIVEMAVIIQEMVAAVWSGVAFSKNPMTGLSEVIVEGISGTSGQTGQREQSPERWVSKWGLWLQKPVLPGMPEALAEKIVRQTSVIARRYGSPVDVEWAFDGHRLFFLQVRGITSLDIPVYFNRIAREMLPGIIKPLVWSVNTRLKNARWTEILGQLTGDFHIPPESLTGHFYYRDYFNMAVFGRAFEKLGMPYEALELLTGMEAEGPEKPQMHPGLRILPRLPGIIALIVRLLTIEREQAKVVRRQMKVLHSLAGAMAEDPSSAEGRISAEGRTPAEWLRLIDRLHEEMIPVTRLNILVPMMGMMYGRMLESLLKKSGVDARRLDLSDIQSAVEEYRPHIHMARLQRKYFVENRQMTSEERSNFQRDLADFLDRFGHFSDSGNDFSSVPWRETPELISRMIEQPVVEPVTSATGAETSKIRFEALDLHATRRIMTRWLYHRSCRFTVHREEISSLYTYGYGLFRTGFLSLGGKLAAQGCLGQPSEIFYLYLKEVQELSMDPKAFSVQDRIRLRLDEMEMYREVSMPETIFGSVQPPISTGLSSDLRGIPTSLGIYSGTARVMHGLAEFDRLEPGDVLVIPFSDVGWTPLFGKAGAVVSESGGMLSHSSIMAREYRIPAVVSVPNACLIPEGSTISVNGFTGEIRMQKAEAFS